MKIYASYLYKALLFSVAQGLIADDQAALITGEKGTIVPRIENDPRFKPVDSHILTFPLAAEDFERWQTYEDSVILGSKIILSPEAVGSSGYMQSLIPNPIKDTWVARIDFKIARDKFKRKDWMNGDGMAIYYLRTVSTEPP
jgi:hypothetical protein